MSDAIDVSAPPKTPMEKLIDRLFREAEIDRKDRFPISLHASDVPQAPALECVIVLHGFQGSLRGTLSTTPEGVLRFLSPGSDNGGPVLVEQFFDYSAVLTIAVLRPITGSAPSFSPSLIVPPH